jgi:hypothetical protein
MHTNLNLVDVLAKQKNVEMKRCTRSGTGWIVLQSKRKTVGGKDEKRNIKLTPQSG